MSATSGWIQRSRGSVTISYRLHQGTKLFLKRSVQLLARVESWGFSSHNGRFCCQGSSDAAYGEDFSYLYRRLCTAPIACRTGVAVHTSQGAGSSPRARRLCACAVLVSARAPGLWWASLWVRMNIRDKILIANYFLLSVRQAALAFNKM